MPPKKQSSKKRGRDAPAKPKRTQGTKRKNAKPEPEPEPEPGQKPAPPKPDYLMEPNEPTADEMTVLEEQSPQKRLCHVEFDFAFALNHEPGKIKLSKKIKLSELPSSSPQRTHVDLKSKVKHDGVLATSPDSPDVVPNQQQHMAPRCLDNSFSHCSVSDTSDTNNKDTEKWTKLLQSIGISSSDDRVPLCIDLDELFAVSPSSPTPPASPAPPTPPASPASPAPPASPASPASPTLPVSPASPVSPATPEIRRLFEITADSPNGLRQLVTAHIRVSIEELFPNSSSP
jgi:hypothetical protein